LWCDHDTTSLPQCRSAIAKLVVSAATAFAAEDLTKAEEADLMIALANSCTSSSFSYSYSDSFATLPPTPAMLTNDSLTNGNSTTTQSPTPAMLTNGTATACTSSCSAKVQAVIGDGDQAAVCALTDEDWSCVNIEDCPFTSEIIAVHCDCDSGILFDDGSE